jgi:PEP-CTERM motif
LIVVPFKPRSIAMRIMSVVFLTAILALATPPARAELIFSTGNPDGLIGTLSRPTSPGKVQTETADDFVLTQASRIDQATFTGLLPAGTPLSSVARVEIELYHVFPGDSANPPSGNVLTRFNSPADVEIGSATRDSLDGSLSFNTSLLNPNFSVANTVVNGIHKAPNQFTGGEGPATGEEVRFNIGFNRAIVLPADHYFFRPEVELTNGNFLWLSAPKPIVPPGTAFPPGFTDLQSWTRNDDLAPDWSRIGTDIVGGNPVTTYNASFSLSGSAVPEPSSLALAALGGSLSLGVAAYCRRRRAD